MPTENIFMSPIRARKVHEDFMLFEQDTFTIFEKDLRICI